MSPEVAAYREAAGRLENQFKTEPWLTWWQGIGVEEVFIPISFWGETARITMRRSNGKLTAVRYRPPESVPDDPVAAAAAARSDLLSLIERVRRRFNPPEPPELLD